MWCFHLKHIENKIGGLTNLENLVSGSRKARGGVALRLSCRVRFRRAAHVPAGGRAAGDSEPGGSN